MQQIEGERCENSSVMVSPYKNLTLKEAESYIEGNLVTTARAYVATSQQPEKTGLCLYRSQFPCTLAEEDKQVAGDGADCTHSCCWNCVKHGKCRLECYALAQRPEAELPKEQQNPEKAAETAAEELEPEVIDAEFKEVSDGKEIQKKG